MKFPYYAQQHKREYEDYIYRVLNYPEKKYSKICSEHVVTEDNSGTSFSTYRKVTWHLDAEGKLQKEHVLYGHPGSLHEVNERYEYTGLQKRIISNDNLISIVIYDENNRVMSQTDERDNTRQEFEYDAKNRITRITEFRYDELKGYTQYLYDEQDRIVKMPKYGYDYDENREYRERGLVLFWETALRYTEENNQTVCITETWGDGRFYDSETFFISQDGSVLRHQNLNKKGTLESETLYDYQYYANGDYKEIVETEISYSKDPSGSLYRKTRYSLNYEQAIAL